jgi:hypothetical protein
MNGEICQFKVLLEWWFYFVFAGEQDEQMLGFLLLEAMETARRHFGTAFFDQTIYDFGADATPIELPSQHRDRADFIYRYLTFT